MDLYHSMQHFYITEVPTSSLSTIPHACRISSTALALSIVYLVWSMALAKERNTTQDSNMNTIQACSLYNSMCAGNSVQTLDGTSSGLYNVYENYHKIIPEKGDEATNGGPKNFGFGRLPSLVDPSIAKGIIYGELNSSKHEDAQFVINFKPSGYNTSLHSCGSLLSFEQGEEGCSKILHTEEYPIWREHHVIDRNYQWNQLNPNSSNESQSSEDLNCLETASSYGPVTNNPVIKDSQLVDESLTWLYSGVDASEDSKGAEPKSHKRPNMGGELQSPNKKPCVGSSKKSKSKIIMPSKDPQSLAAKNRRERISERLKTLQDLVPNGSKVDLVTMLEKAISYVKFLQLQVKVLATDEFWPAQGGEAPDVSQVKEAIDAILSSHKDRDSSSK